MTTDVMIAWLECQYEEEQERLTKAKLNLFKIEKFLKLLYNRRDGEEE